MPKKRPVFTKFRDIEGARSRVIEEKSWKVVEFSPLLAIYRSWDRSCKFYSAEGRPVM